MDYCQFPQLATQLKKKYTHLRHLVENFINNLSAVVSHLHITPKTFPPKNAAQIISEFKSEPVNARHAQNELAVLDQYKPGHKDIIIVVKDQYDYIRKCVDSIFKYTEDFNLYIWDNGSQPQTASYLEELSKRKNIAVFRSPDNQGFLLPNNRMVEKSDSPYIILLNSDTEVKENWDKALIATLQTDANTAVSGYMGGVLNEQATPLSNNLGYQIDYVCGYCMCFSRATYRHYGLFDENLKFAYFEDSEFCIRLKEKGLKLYALHLDLVLHYENKTIQEVASDQNIQQFLAANFQHNQQYVLNKWKDYFAKRRVALTGQLGA